MRKRCPKDSTGVCPYRNETGTCFGFCLQEILKEQTERKLENEQIKEEKPDE